MNTTYEELKKRKPTQKQRMLQMLRDAGDKGVKNIDFTRISIRYGGMLGEFYKEGYKIDTIPLDGGVVKYILCEEPTAEFKKKKDAKDAFFDSIKEKFGLELANELDSIMEKINVNLRYKAGTHKI